MSNVGPNNQLVVSENKNNNGNNMPTEDDPIMINGVYNKPAHVKLERKRFERDLTIPKMVEAFGKDTCKFVEVGSAKGGTVITLTYHPNPEAQLIDECKWITIKTFQDKAGHRIYTDIANGKIEWYCKVIDGNFDKYFLAAFEEDITAGTYENATDKFVSKATAFIRFNPNKKDTTYGVYINRFQNLIRSTDPKFSSVKLLNICRKIAYNFRYSLGDEFKNSSEAVILSNLRDVTTRPTLMECSKAVHKKLSAIDAEARAANLELDKLEKEALEEEQKQETEKRERLNKLMNMNQQQNKAIESAKRGIEDVSGHEQDENPQKRLKTVEVPLLED